LLQIDLINEERLQVETIDCLIYFDSIDFPEGEKQTTTKEKKAEFLTNNTKRTKTTQVSIHPPFSIYPYNSFVLSVS